MGGWKCAPVLLSSNEVRKSDSHHFNLSINWYAVLLILLRLVCRGNHNTDDEIKV